MKKRSVAALAAAMMTVGGLAFAPAAGAGIPSITCLHLVQLSFTPATTAISAQSPIAECFVAPQ